MPLVGNSRLALSDEAPDVRATFKILLPHARLVSVHVGRSWDELERGVVQRLELGSTTMNESAQGAARDRDAVISVRFFEPILRIGVAAFVDYQMGNEAGRVARFLSDAVGRLCGDDVPATASQGCQGSGRRTYRTSMPSSSIANAVAARAASEPVLRPHAYPCRSGISAPPPIHRAWPRPPRASAPQSALPLPLPPRTPVFVPSSPSREHDRRATPSCEGVHSGTVTCRQRTNRSSCDARWHLGISWRAPTSGHGRAALSNFTRWQAA